MTSRIVLVICLLILVSLLTFSVRGVSQTGDLGQEITQQVLELEKMKKEQTKLDQELRNLEKTQKNVLSEIGKIDQQIGKLEKDITTSRKRITELEGERKRLKKDIGGLSQDITATRSKVFQAMVRAYKNNTSIDFWSVFMGSANPAETEEQWYLFQKYSDYELAIITKYLGQKKSLQNKLKEVEQRIRLEAVLKEKLVLEDKNVKRLKETKNAMLSQVQVDQKRFQDNRKELIAAQRNLKNIIAELQKELKKSREKSTKVENLPPVKKGLFFWPVTGGKVVRNFGIANDPVYKIQVYNPGIDIAAKRGDNVYAAQDGVVLLARSIRGYGKTILLDHGQDVITMYSHMDSLVVNPGETVKGGQVIGAVGDTGLTDQTILHFEVRVGTNAKEENPLRWLK